MPYDPGPGAVSLRCSGGENHRTNLIEPGNPGTAARRCLPEPGRGGYVSASVDGNREVGDYRDFVRGRARYRLGRFALAAGAAVLILGGATLVTTGLMTPVRGTGSSVPTGLVPPDPMGSTCPMVPVRHTVGPDEVPPQGVAYPSPAPTEPCAAAARRLTMALVNAFNAAAPHATTAHRDGPGQPADPQFRLNETRHQYEAEFSILATNGRPAYLLIALFPSHEQSSPGSHCSGTPDKECGVGNRTDGLEVDVWSGADKAGQVPPQLNVDVYRPDGTHVQMYLFWGNQGPPMVDGRRVPLPLGQDQMVRIATDPAMTLFP